MIAWLLRLLAVLLLLAPVARAQAEPDYAAFDASASLVERLLEGGRAADFLLSSERDKLTAWRDIFIAAHDQAAPRLRTQTDQLDALGEPPEDGIEDARVAARRTELQDELRRLQAPEILAEEARVRANGLIAEIDAELRERQARALGERVAWPINPAVWPDAARALGDGLSGLALETRDALATREGLNRLLGIGPSAAFFGLVGLVLIFRGRGWSLRAERRLDDGQAARPGRRALDFLVSLGQVALPFLGVIMLVGAVDAAGLTGARLTRMTTALPVAALYIFVARWLADRFFPLVRDGVSGPLEVSPAIAAQLRWYANGLGWTFAAHVLALTFIGLTEAGPDASAALIFPVYVVEGLMMFGIGWRLRAEMRRANPSSEDPASFRDRIIGTVGQVLMALGVAGPCVAAVGFDAAADFLLRPAALTLALIGITILLQRLIFDIYAALSRAPDGRTDALAPVLLGFVLTLVALPVLALIWGARMSDLTEVWTQFREGFDFGDTRISPSDFMVFVLVFAVGYILTRLIQGGLRSAVLPKTRLDIGGQNAIASGVGYIGIFAAALIAITSAGLNLSTLGYVAGALSVGIGFGLQNVVSNFVSGIILLVERPISQGDWIEVGGQMGYVRDISVRATRIETFDRTDVIVPNADFISGTVINWTRGNSVGRIILPIGVAYGTDTHKVSDILLKIAREHPMVLHNPEPYVLFKGFGADALEFEIRAILRDINWVLSVQTEMNHAIAKAFAEAGIEIPFAQRDIWLRNPEALHPGAGSAQARSTTGPSDGWSEALRGEKPDILRGEDE